ncbi:MAG: SGNH/GDSL hydrolase family protein [Ferruginibacter sp.]
MSQETEAQDWANLLRFKNENSQLGPALAKEKRVVFMGNSITEGWSNLMPGFFYGKPYINRGIGGQTSPQMLLRFRQDVVALKPKLVVILAGTNDIAGNTGPSTLEMIEDNIAAMAEIAAANKIKVILSSVLPVFDYPWKRGLQPAEKIVALNKWIKNYCVKNGCIYLDYHTAMKDERNGLKSIYGDDGVHPNAAGYKVMALLAEKAINLALVKNKK